MSLLLLVPQIQEPLFQPPDRVSWSPDVCNHKLSFNKEHVRCMIYAINTAVNIQCHQNLTYKIWDKAI